MKTTQMKLQTNNLWFTSDTHYGHHNIVKGVTNWDISTEHKQDQVRSFETVEDMDECIVNNINEVVKENDFLIHLGDWSFGGIENITHFRKQIICKNIILITGNHDHHIINNKENVKSNFLHVAHYEELSVSRNSKTRASKFILCHYPIISWNNQRTGSIMLHGHQHLKDEKRFGDGKRMDIGLDGNPDFRPYHIEEILEIMNTRNIGYDRH